MLVIGFLVGAVVLAVAALQAMQEDPSSAETVALRIGVGADQESHVLGHVIAQLLEAAEIPAEVVAFGHARDARQAIVLREVDVLPSYTGAVHLDVYGWADPPGDPETSFEAMRDADAQRGLHWLHRTEANATFAFLVGDAVSDEVESLQELSFVNTAPDALLCVDPDFAARPDGLAELARIYGISDEVLAGQVLPVSPREAVAAVTRGDCVAALTSATDGQAWAAGLRPLADPSRVLPAFVVAVVATSEALENFEGLETALAAFSQMTTEMLATWNGRIASGESMEAVALDAAITLTALARADEQETVEQEEAEQEADEQDPAGD
jgi:osmoprotectant transport system substrate-binding protein